MVNTAAEWVFWGSLGLIVYSFAGYPMLVMLMGLVWPKPRRDASLEPSVSIQIAAYNESGSIEKKVRDTLDLDYPPEKVEVVVVSDGSSDGTDEIMRRICETEPRVRFFRLGRGGKTAAQNYGATQCRNELIVFSDATSVYEKDALRKLVSWFAGGDVAAVSGICRFFDPARGQSPTGLPRSIYGDLEQAMRFYQGCVRTATACSGPMYAVRRESYVPLDPHAVSDMMEPIEIVRTGKRVLYALDAVSWEETTKNIGDEFKMRVRVTTQGIYGVIDALRKLPPWRYPWIAFQLFSHKFLRYFVPVPLALLLLSNIAMVATGGPWWVSWLLAGQASFYGATLLALVLPPHVRPSLLTLPLYFCTLNAAIVVSFREALRGNRFATWETIRD